MIAGDGVHKDFVSEHVNDRQGTACTAFPWGRRRWGAPPDLAVTRRGVQSDVPIVPGCEPGAVLTLLTRTTGAATGEDFHLRRPLKIRARADWVRNPAGWIAPALNTSALNLDRLPAGHPVHAGLEITVRAVPESPRIRKRTLVFYVPCTAAFLLGDRIALRLWSGVPPTPRLPP
jgi:hypothetical protein